VRFYLNTLTAALRASGFLTIAGKERIQGFALWVAASKRVMSEEARNDLAGQVLPE